MGTGQPDPGTARRAGRGHPGCKAPSFSAHLCPQSWVQRCPGSEGPQGAGCPWQGQHTGQVPKRASPSRDPPSRGLQSWGSTEASALGVGAAGVPRCPRPHGPLSPGPSASLGSHQPEISELFPDNLGSPHSQQGSGVSRGSPPQGAWHRPGGEGVPGTATGAPSGHSGWAPGCEAPCGAPCSETGGRSGAARLTGVSPGSLGFLSCRSTFSVNKTSFKWLV